MIGWKDVQPGLSEKYSSDLHSLPDKHQNPGPVFIGMGNRPTFLIVFERNKRSQKKTRRRAPRLLGTCTIHIGAQNTSELASQATSDAETLKRLRKTPPSTPWHQTGIRLYAQLCVYFNKLKNLFRHFSVRQHITHFAGSSRS